MYVCFFFLQFPYLLNGLFLLALLFFLRLTLCDAQLCFVFSNSMERDHVRVECIQE
uniref:Uncharacterized protein n=1 Tax=Trypanosoma brucei TaxID=5691 RepID=Q581N7_9TRYP|nr:hypothetical protein, unlikely [Trypanosoma brucei]